MSEHKPLKSKVLIEHLGTKSLFTDKAQIKRNSIQSHPWARLRPKWIDSVLRVWECQKKGSTLAKFSRCFACLANSHHVISPTEIKLGLSFTEPGFLTETDKTQSSGRHKS